MILFFQQKLTLLCTLAFDIVLHKTCSNTFNSLTLYQASKEAGFNPQQSMYQIICYSVNAIKLLVAFASRDFGGFLI